ncbi:response regulator [Marinivivus vitaminiproducens]|uniref:response regulator n=1 Tax=Marinivivus vitaminiproducens TaxID=3035935 RepID=UPI00279FAA81|nr:response regulator [Geminicoccaceae bacterium SCSIO 64248]
MKTFAQLRILIVNDQAPIRRMLRSLLSRWGFTRIDEVGDGAAALRRLRQRQYGLVISDGDMRPTSGRALLWQVRADPLLKSVPFILLTAPRERLAAVVRGIGASSCLPKPLDARALREAVSDALAKSGLSFGGQAEPSLA